MTRAMHFIAGLCLTALSPHVAWAGTELVPVKEFVERFHNLEGAAQFDTLLGRISSDPRVASVDDAVQTLPDIFRTNYALIYKSDSLQRETTPLNDIAGPVRPKVVSMNSDGSLFVAYNSGHTSTGDTLEAIVWNNESLVFDFFHIKFGDRAGAAVVSKNPPVCATCHTRHQRPLWNSYLHWYGTVGTLDHTLPYIRPLGADVPDPYQLARAEFAYYNRFLATKSEEQRYAFLDPKPRHYPNWPDAPNADRSFVSNFLFGAFSHTLTQVMLANKIARGEINREDVGPKELCVALDFQTHCGRYNGGYFHGYHDLDTLDQNVRLFANRDSTSHVTSVRDWRDNYPVFHAVSPEVSQSFVNLDRLVSFGLYQ